jgi:hypothetical protein
MGEVVSGQSASFYMTTEPARSRGASRLVSNSQIVIENSFIDRPIIKSQPLARECVSSTYTSLERAISPASFKA